jgi:hypothetical protein
MLAHDRNGRLVERYWAPPTCRLRLADARFAARLNNSQSASVEIYVAPAKAQRFASTHSGGCEEHPQAVEPITSHTRVIEE